jgi:hypothetical protein
MSATIRNTTGQKVGSVDPDGIIRNFTGQKIGYVDHAGNVRDHNRMVIGRVNEDGVIRRELTHKLGHVDEHGNIFNYLGMKLGKAIMDKDEEVEIEYRIDEPADGTLDPTETMSEVIHIVPVEHETVSIAQVGAAALLLLFQSTPF